jgi:hypothetical protein
VTKVPGSRQRCERCGRQFRPKTGGRPASFCGHSCRQRAYEARRRSRTASDSTGVTAQNSSRAWRIAPLIARSQKKPFFEADEVRTKLRSMCGPQPLAGVDFERVARDLDIITQGYLSFFQAGTAPTAGEYQKRVLRLTAPATALLAQFGLQGTLHHPNNTDTINAIHALERGVPAGERSDLYLRREMAAAIRAPKAPSRAQALRLSLRCIQFLWQCAELAASELRGLFVEVTGNKKKYTVDDVKGPKGAHWSTSSPGLRRTFVTTSTSSSRLRTQAYTSVSQSSARRLGASSGAFGGPPKGIQLSQKSGIGRVLLRRFRLMNGREYPSGSAQFLLSESRGCRQQSLR